MKTHLKFLGYILNAGLLYIGLQRVKDIWDCLVSNPDACESDAEVHDIAYAKLEFQHHAIVPVY